MKQVYVYNAVNYPKLLVAEPAVTAKELLCLFLVVDFVSVLGFVSGDSLSDDNIILLHFCLHRSHSSSQSVSNADVSSALVSFEQLHCMTLRSSQFTKHDNKNVSKNHSYMVPYYQKCLERLNSSCRI